MNKNALHALCITTRAITASMLPVCLAAVMAASAYGKEAATVKPTTTGDPAIPIAELEWRLKPLTVENLEVEANGWRDLLKQKVEQIARAHIALLKQKEQQKERADKEGKILATDTATENEKEEKTDRLDELTKLNEERTVILDRARLVVDAYEEKGGEDAKVASYRKYMDVAGGVKVDVSDTQALWVTAQGWITSKEGGLRWLKNISLFVVTVIAFYLLARLLSKAANRALAATQAASTLLRNFLVTAVRRLTVIIGVVVGLAALEVNIGPLLAVIGAAGFVVAFALQNSLGNFASGILIMMFKPFDVGDAVEVAGTAGKIEAVNLLSTQMKTFDNKAVVIPNNAIWGGVITNITATGQRRVDLQFGIGYDDDIDKAQHILEDIVNSHELVLKDPEPVIRMNELGDSSVNFIVRPWAKTEDVWTVYWDITREVKKRFDKEGISIPFPQRDIHVHNVASPASAAAKETAA
jgi:small conductance mechanosensitive channel